jgi:predicted KAP-like P-loop ATPase
MKGEAETTETWLSDDPIGGDALEADLLDRHSFAASSVALLERVRTQSPSSVIALIGPWGAGKSSVLNMIRAEIARMDASENDWIVVDFNPWYYPDLPSLQAGFFKELHSALPTGPTWSKARESVSKVGRAVAPIGSLGSLIGLDASKIIEAAAGWIGGDESLSNMRQQAEKALRDADRPVLMIVDDLDRLAPDELLLVLKLIRLSGRLPNIYYLVTYDEDTLLDALSRTGLVGNNDLRRAVDYLEKIIQIRLDLPPLREQQTSNWVDEALNSFARKFQISLSDEDGARFSRVYHAHIRARLNTPRSIKRYFSQVEAFFQPIKGEVDPVDFLLITWLRTSEPLVYEMVVTQKAALLGTTAAWTVKSILNKEDPKARKELWNQHLTRARVADVNVEGVAEVLGQLFPRFEDAWKEAPATDRSREARAGRIANPDYFDRYFAFEIPSEDIPDALVELAFRQIASNEVGHERGRVEKEFADKTVIILSKLERLAETNKAASPLLLEWLTHRYHDLEDQLALVTSRHHLRWVTGRIFVQLDPDQKLSVIEAAAEAEEGLSLASYWLRAADNERRFEQDETAASAASRFFVKLVRRHFDERRYGTVFDVPAYDWQLIWEWRRVDKDDVHAWFQSTLDGGQWSVLDVVARLVGSEAVMGTATPVWRLNELDLDVVEDLIGVETALGALETTLDAWDGPTPVSRSVEATPESRRSFAIASLQHERDRRRANKE